MKLAIVVFDGVQSLDVSGPMDVFAEANGFLPAHRHYDITLVGVGPGPVRCSNGMILDVPVDYLHYADTPDLLLVAGGPRLPEARPDAAFLAWLHDKAQATGRFGSVCNGAFLLGHAGLLDGREVTTHWHDAKRLAEQFPRAKVRPDKIFVRDDRLFTSAGVTAGIDLCLALVAEDVGHDVALRVAKKLIVYIRREGGQSQFSPYLAVGPAPDSIVAKVLRHVTEHISEVLSIEQLADAVGVSRRTFSRTFDKHAGVTPSQFVEQVRVDYARQLLEETDMPVKTVAFRCGFHSAAHMRLIFARRLGITPRPYRARFRAIDAAATAVQHVAADDPGMAQARSTLAQDHPCPPP